MNTRRQVLIAAVAAVLLTVLFVVFALAPRVSDISETRDQIEEAKTQEQTLQNELTRLRGLQEESTTTTARLARANRFLPAEPDLPGFIRLVQASATKASVELSSIAPSPPTEVEGVDGVSAIQVTLNAKAGYRRIEDFLTRLEGLERVFEVTQLSLSPEADELSDTIVLNASITGRMFVVGLEARDPEPSPSPEATP